MITYQDSMPSSSADAKNDASEMEEDINSFHKNNRNGNISCPEYILGTYLPGVIAD